MPSGRKIAPASNGVLLESATLSASRGLTHSTLSPLSETPSLFWSKKTCHPHCQHPFELGAMATALPLETALVRACAMSLCRSRLADARELLRMSLSMAGAERVAIMLRQESVINVSIRLNPFSIFASLQNWVVADVTGKACECIRMSVVLPLRPAVVASVYFARTLASVLVVKKGGSVCKSVKVFH